MSKPLELTIYPPLSPLVQRGVEINIEQGCYPYLGFSTEMHVPGIVRMHTKRLTDAEMAAEWWRACLTVHQLDHAFDSSSRALTLHRFATHPHYFEADR